MNEKKYICKYCGKELKTNETMCRNCELRLPYIREMLRLAKKVCGIER